MSATKTNAEVLVDVDNVSKKYCRHLHRSLRYGVADLVRESIGLGAKMEHRPGEFYALRNVSFQVRRGESLAIIGPNGAGKSSMLKILNGVIKPTDGSVRIFGRVAALTTLGAGFNPILSGRENAYINASIFGFTDREMDQRFEAMVEFSELGDAINDPVKTYSSGMKARLGFSIGAFLEPDVLLMDEVLAAGDRRFRRKCFEHFATLTERGTSIIIVSHVVDRVCNMCDRTLVLKSGEVFFNGPGREGYEKYYDALGIESPRTKRLRLKQEAEAKKAEQATSPPPSARILEVSSVNASGRKVDFVRKQRNLRLRIAVESDEPRDDLRISVIVQSRNRVLMRMATKPGELVLEPNVPQTVELFARVANVLVGAFSIMVRLASASSGDVYDVAKLPVAIQRRKKVGSVNLPHSFKALPADAPPLGKPESGTRS